MTKTLIYSSNHISMMWIEIIWSIYSKFFSGKQDQYFSISEISICNIFYYPLPLHRSIAVIPYLLFISIVRYSRRVLQYKWKLHSYLLLYPIFDVSFYRNNRIFLLRPLVTSRSSGKCVWQHHVHFRNTSLPSIDGVDTSYPSRNMYGSQQARLPFSHEANVRGSY